MEIIEEVLNEIITLSPVGELDANSSMEIDDKIEAALKKGIVKFHIKCDQLKYISSAGLGVFVSYLDEVRKLGGDFVFSEMSPSIKKVFSLLGLNQVLSMHEGSIDPKDFF